MKWSKQEGSKNVNYAKTCKLNENRGINTFGGNRGKFMSFMEIGGTLNMYHWLKRDERP